MNLALWIVTGLLATAYLFGGAAKVFTSKEKIADFGSSGKWVKDFSSAAVKGIGLLEVLGAIGLILPAVLDIAPVLVPIAAVGLAIIMVGAMIVRIRRGEFTLMIADAVYLVLLGFVIWGRFGPEAFTG